jgi:hypothetical protein
MKAEGNRKQDVQALVDIVVRLGRITECELQAVVQKTS